LDWMLRQRGGSMETSSWREMRPESLAEMSMGRRQEDSLLSCYLSWESW
jgi:hypothetical protein